MTDKHSKSATLDELNDKARIIMGFVANRVIQDALEGSKSARIMIETRLNGTFDWERMKKEFQERAQAKRANRQRPQTQITNPPKRTDI